MGKGEVHLTPPTDIDALVYNLTTRASIRRNISTRKSVQEGKPDRIADLLEQAAATLLYLAAKLKDKDGRL